MNLCCPWQGIVVPQEYNLEAPAVGGNLSSINLPCTRRKVWACSKHRAASSSWGSSGICRIWIDRPLPAHHWADVFPCDAPGWRLPWWMFRNNHSRRWNRCTRFLSFVPVLSENGTLPGGASSSPSTRAFCRTSGSSSVFFGLSCSGVWPVSFCSVDLDRTFHNALGNLFELHGPDSGHRVLLWFRTTQNIGSKIRISASKCPCVRPGNRSLQNGPTLESGFSVCWYFFATYPICCG